MEGDTGKQKKCMIDVLGFYVLFLYMEPNCIQDKEKFTNSNVMQHMSRGT